jgi:SAM-dependent methyltransferase
MTNEASADAAIRLIGRVGGKRLLELGCGTGETAVAFARQGATVIGVDGSPDHIAAARAAAEAAEVRLELHAGDLADLAFLRADSIDVAYSAGALAGVEHLDRLFRQVHRVLRPGAPFAFSLPHPVALAVATEDAEGTLPMGRTYVERSYFDDAKVDIGGADEVQLVSRHRLSAVFTALVRAGFRVDALVEPEPPREKKERALLPEVVVWRARKEGS